MNRCKTLLIGMILSLVVGGVVIGQNQAPVRPGMPDVAAQKAAMQRLAGFVGKWQGTGTMQMGPQSHTFDQVETCEWGLDGLIIKVVGRGTEPNAPADAPPAHDAFAVISYNDLQKKYEFRAYTGRGFANTFDFVVHEERHFAWEFPMPGNLRR